MGRLIVNENKLKPIAKEYVSQYERAKPYVRSLLAAFSMAVVYILMSCLIWFNVQPNIVDNLIYLVFAASTISSISVVLFVVATFLGIGVLNEHPQKKLEALKKSDFGNKSLINCFIDLFFFSASLLYVALLATTNHSFIFVFYCMFIITNYGAVKLIKSLFTDILNNLTEEDFEILNSMPEPEEV